MAVMNSKAQAYIDTLHLQPHPEGGWYRETYRSAEHIAEDHLPSRYSGDRSYSTAIYFLLPGETFSAWHRIQSDEVWHHYDGDAVEIFVINDSGNLQVIKLGKDLAAGEQPQAVIGYGDWFASRCAVQDGYSLVGCTVAPGFDFADFEMAERAALMASYPQHAAIITELTRV